MKNDKQEKRTVSIGNTNIEYLLIRKRVKNINLHIKPDCKVYVSANNKVPIKAIDDFIILKADFILKALKKFNQIKSNISKPQQYISGEKISFLGEFLTLEIIQCNKESVTKNDNTLYINVKNIDDKDKKEKLVKKWLRTQCEELFEKLSKEIHKNFIVYGVAYPQIKIRKMKSRWGSCQPKQGIITLNEILIHAPLPCIEYVVLHEFCHFIHPNHSKQFYGFVEKFMPDWKERRNQLQKYYIV